MTPQEFVDQTIGKVWDIDNNRPWCWDLLAKFCQMVGVPLYPTIYCAETGYVRDIWNMRKTNGILLYFDEVHDYQDGDWVIWDSDNYNMTPNSHVAMYWKGLAYNQTKDRAAYLLDLDFSKAKGGFRWKGWSDVTIKDGFSEVLYQDTTMSLYKAPEGYSLYMLSAGINQLQDIRFFDHPGLEILAACNCGYFQMSKDQADPYGTHYGVEQTFDGVDLAPKKNGLQVLYQKGDYIGACRSDQYWYTRDQVQFAFSPYSVIRHEGKTVIGEISTDLGSKEFVTNMQTMVMFLDGRWCLCISKNPVLPAVMLGFAESVNAQEAVLCDSGGSTQMMAYSNGNYNSIMYTGRKIPNVLVIARPKADYEPIQGGIGEDEQDTIVVDDPSENKENTEMDNVTKTLLPDRVYDILKWVALIALPAIAVFVLTMGTDLTENYEVIAKFINGIAVLLGSLIGVSTVQYNRSKE